jgi:hypothetical protein
MNKLLIAAATSLVAFAPMGAQATTRSTVIATTAVTYCAYQMGHMTISEAVEYGSEYLNDQGISTAQSNRIIDASDFDREVVAAIEMGGGCEKLTEDL